MNELLDKYKRRVYLYETFERLFLLAQKRNTGVSWGYLDLIGEYQAVIQNLINGDSVDDVIRQLRQFERRMGDGNANQVQR